MQLIRYEQARSALAAVHSYDEVKDIMDQAESMSLDEWVWHARGGFKPSTRKPCFVCGKYASLTQAHHVTPLSMQAAKDRRSINHKHEWLCPTHHAAIHIFINQRFSGRDLASKASINIMADIGAEEIRPLLALLDMVAA